jgi:hypothetical protein
VTVLDQPPVHVAQAVVVANSKKSHLQNRPEVLNLVSATFAIPLGDRQKSQAELDGYVRLGQASTLGHRHRRAKCSAIGKNCNIEEV